MSKLPNEIRIEIARKSNNDVWKIEDLLEAREASEGIKASDFARKPTPSNNTQYNIPGTPRSSTFLSNQGLQGAKNSPFVVHIAKNFIIYSASCSKVIDPGKRKEILQRKNRLFIYLKVGHLSTECQTTKTCRHSNKRHHQSICDQTAPNQGISSIANIKYESFEAIPRRYEKRSASSNRDSCGHQFAMKMIQEFSSIVVVIVRMLPTISSHDSI